MEGVQILPKKHENMFFIQLINIESSFHTYIYIHIYYVCFTNHTSPAAVAHEGVGLHTYSPSVRQLHRFEHRLELRLPQRLFIQIQLECAAICSCACERVFFTPVLSSGLFSNSSPPQPLKHRHRSSAWSRA